MLTERANYTLEDMDRHSVFHPLTSIEAHMKSGPLIIQGSKGVTLRDRQGRELIDCNAGLWCVNIGYGRPELGDAAKKAIDELNYFHIFGGASNEPAIRLADRILRLFSDHTPARGLARVFYGCSGSDANDTNIKLVRYYNNLLGRKDKKKIIARIGAYHGLTASAAALTGISVYHRAWDLASEGIIHASCPHYYRFGGADESEEQFRDKLIEEIKDIIAREGANTIAAFIAEPVMGTGGVIRPPGGYYEKLQQLLQENDILFIADEVITGFGRIGEWFGTGHYGLQPDIVTLAKGLTSAYFPVSASVIGEKIWSVLERSSGEFGPVMHGFTYSGHPVGAAIGLVNLDILEQEELPANSRRMGRYLLETLRSRYFDHPFIGDIRGEGLMIGVEFIADKTKRRPFPSGSNPHQVVARLALENALMIRGLPIMETVAFSPPLCITKAECDEVIERFGRTLSRATPELAALARNA